MLTPTLPKQYWTHFKTQSGLYETLNRFELNDGTVVFGAALYEFSGAAGFECVQVKFIDEANHVINITDFHFDNQRYLMAEMIEITDDHASHYYQLAEDNYLNLKRYQA